MTRGATKARGNPYYEARKHAAKEDPILRSREGAAERLNIHPATVAAYELETVKTPQAEVVADMAQVYQAPILLNRYCMKECPIGQLYLPELEKACLDRLTVQMMAKMKRIGDMKADLLDIAEDGKIDSHEREQAEAIADYLKSLSKLAMEFEIYIKHEGGSHG